MIVLNPPVEPAYFQLVTRSPEHRAVETAIRIARVPFYCAEMTDPEKWRCLLQRHGDRTTFVLGLQTPMPISVAIPGGDVDEDESPSMIVDGAQGVLDLASFIASIAPTPSDVQEYSRSCG